MEQYKKVLVALDPRAEQEFILQKALAVAGTDAELSIISVIEPINTGDMIFPTAKDMESDLIEAAVENIIEPAKKLAIPNERCFVEVGRPASVIHRKSAEMEADLIIVGSHGRHGLRLLLGSTANAVLHGAQCDVLAVRIDSK